MSVQRKQLVRDMPDRSRVVATIELRQDDERLSDSFSVTGELYEPHGTWSGAARHKNGKDCDSCGRITDDVLRAFPELRPLVDIHLSAPDGEPMHAEANGWYFYAGSRDDIEGGWTPGLGDAWRMAKAGYENNPLGYALHLAQQTLRVSEIPSDITTREQFAEFVNQQRERWQREADEARALIESLS